MKKPENLLMRTPNLADENYKVLKVMFPNAITEIIDEEGNIVRAVDADVLTQEINTHVVSGRKERYQFTWPDKKKSILLANAPIASSLRPCREESVDFDNTENLYIEGDNLDVLKLLRETYLNRIKMIYIDPPYNTGNDFVYDDDFAEDTDEFLRRDLQYDEQGNRLVSNFESNGRFHTDWLNMMYPRLRLAKDLLADDGVIFISIDDNEVENLKKICNEIFGSKNFVTEFIWKCRNSLQHDEPLVSKQTERILLYTKNKTVWSFDIGINLNRIRKPFDATEYKNPDNDPRGPWLSSGKTRNDGRPSYTVVSPTGVRFTRPWIPSPSEFSRWEKEGLIWWGKNGDSIPRKKAFLKDFKGNAISDILFDEYTDEIRNENSIRRIKRWEIGTTESGTKGLKELFEGKALFDYPKPWTLIKYFITISTGTNDIILDSFSGSSTTAHAVMKLNAEDGGKRKFIMVNIPEKTDEKSEAYKAGYKNICEIGKERIRRAGKKIIEENKDKEGIQNLDIGFRVLKLDSSNMKEVFYTPDKYGQINFALDGFVDNIKVDRTNEDLLFQVMLDLGIPLSAKIKQSDKIFYVNDNYLIACFDKVDTELITKIAKQRPYYAVFRDSSFISDSDMVNFEQVFATYSPGTIRRIL